MKNLSTIVMSFAALFAGAALAHTELQATVPADGAVIAEAPVDVQLTFSEPVRLTALSIRKDGERKQSLGPLPSEATETFSVPLPATTDDGHYIVAWRALSADTHVMNGEFMFAVGAEGGHGAHMSHKDTPAGEHLGDHHDDRDGAN